MFLKQPLSYAHRQGQLAIQLPPGARDLSLKLQSHEGFVFGTAFSPETVAGNNCVFVWGQRRERGARVVCAFGDTLQQVCVLAHGGV